MSDYTQDQTVKNGSADYSTFGDTFQEGLKRSKEIAQYHQALDKVMPYLESRGITRETAEQFKLGYKSGHWINKHETSAEMLVIPTSPTDYTLRNLNPDSNDRYRAEGNRNPLGVEVLHELTAEDILYITEGEIDALSLIQLGHHAIGLTTAKQLFFSHLDQLQTYPKILIAKDNDATGIGQKKAEDLQEELDKRGIYNDIVNLSGDLKDVNDMLTVNPEELKRLLNLGTAIGERAKQHIANSAGSKIDEFLEAVDQGHYVPINQTGYNLLDQAIGGGLYWGLYVLGAISSLGKTTYLLQLMDQVAEQGSDAIIFSLEMSRHELIAKSLSRETFRYTQSNGINRSNAKTARGIMDKRKRERYNSTEHQVLAQAISQYRQYAGRIYIHEAQGKLGINEIQKAVESHIRITGNRPVILIDYLQLITPINERWSERQNMDHVISNLRVTARDYRVPIIAISSVSRGAYGNREASISSFKESGGIEYGADTAMILQFSQRPNKNGKGEPKQHEIDKHERIEKRKDPREVEVVIVKNRNGETGATVKYLYYPMFNYFTETAQMFDQDTWQTDETIIEV